MDEAIAKITWSDREERRKKREKKRFNKKLKRELLKAEKRKRKNKIREIKKQHRPDKKEKKKITTTKLLIYFIILNCTVVEVYSMIIMYMLKDLSALYSLIGAVVGESIAYAIYCAKSFKENKEEANYKLERDKFNASIGYQSDEEEVSENQDGILDENDIDGMIDEDERDFSDLSDE